jgi:hypothetical protein
MFGWFKPECPVDVAAKRWIEERLHWLSDQFGADTFLRRAMILPTREFFPDPVDGSEASLRNLLDQVCGYMDVDPRRVALQLFTARQNLYIVSDEGKPLPTEAAGLYDNRGDRTIIHLETGDLTDLSTLVGTMAHELAHLRLMGERRVTGDESDNELLTDLTAVFHGFGIFLGNCPRNWDGQYGQWPGTKLRKPEYMTLPMFAYALAHRAWRNEDAQPEWARHLSFHLRPCFKQGLRYLRETGDSTYSPGRGRENP